MKISWLTIVLLVFAASRIQGQVSQPDASASAGQGTIQAQDTPYAVVERGANHRIWQRTTYETTPDGRQIPHIHKYNELATGMCFQQNGQWVNSKEEIDILPSGTAAATQGQHQAYFPGDIYQGVVELVTPDGIHLRSRPLGLSYDDGNHTVLIAELKDSVGQLVGPNQVIYPDAFTDFKADLRYTYTKAGFEQDIVLREQPPAPEAYGLDTQTTRLQVLTEFFGASDPVQTVSVVNQQDGLQDTTLSFGQMKMIQGKAFSIADSAQTKATTRIKGVFVSKSWQHLEGRTFLAEELPVQKIESQLEQLPVLANAVSAMNSPNSVRHKVSIARLLPPVRLVQAATNAVQLARVDFSRERGVVLDYVTINSGEINYKFQGDTTYCVSGEYNLSGTTTFEGGTVIKSDYDGQIDIDANGAVNCQTAAYRPAVFTSVNDNTAGEQIGNGSPGFSDVFCFLNINCSNTVLSNLRFSYTYNAILTGEYGGGSVNNLDVWNSQFVNTDAAISCNETMNLGLHNVLIGNAGLDGDEPIEFWYPGSLIAEQCTFDTTFPLIYGDGSDDTPAFLTNCIVTGACIGDGGEYSTQSVVVLASGSYETNYQTVGAGCYYLATNSPYRNAGTRNISPALLAELRQKTTFPPIVYSNTTISTPWTFNPQAQRDTNNSPDLGYHYDPLDYVFGAMIATSNLTFTAGTAAGWFYNSNGGTYGLAMGDSATAIFNGTVTVPCRWSRYNTVQEGGNGFWQFQSWLGGITGQSYSQAAPAIQAQFTICSMLNSEANAFRDNWTLLNINATDCEFWMLAPGTIMPRRISRTVCLSTVRRGCGGTMGRPI